jgi:CrcB protein
MTSGFAPAGFPAKAQPMSAPPTFAASSLLVAFGGGFGAWLRLMTGRAWTAAIGPIAASAFPYATLTANVLGSLAMGLLVGWLARHGEGGEHWRLLLGVGVLGGYTTFSAFSLEFALFVERGALGMAAVYVAVSLVAGFAALFAGLFVMRAIG